jgi:heptosyltransferase-2
VSAADKVLIVGPSWVGDMVMAQALYRLVKQRSPSAEIHVVAPPWSLPVLERMPEVARGIELGVAHGELALGRRRRVGVALRAEGYTRAIVLPRSAKAALVPWFARAPRRTGFRGEFRYGLLNDRRALDPALDQTVKRFVALGLERGEPLPDAVPPSLRPRLTVDRSNLQRLMQVHGLAGDGPLIALLPGAEYGPAKRWPAERFAELAAELARLGAEIVVLGSAKEAPLGEELRAGADSARVHNLCGNTTLADVVDILSAAAAAVSNDSGLMHMAAAAGTHVVAIYGSSSPLFTPPLSDASTVLYLGLSCSPCFARTCPLGHLNCLRQIDVGAVLAAVKPLLGARARASERSPAGGKPTGG